jgi:hypothetical protein
MTLKNLFSVAFISILLVSCSSNPLDVDTSNVKVDIQFREIRSVLHNSDSSKLMNAHQSYLKEIEEIYNYYLGVCMKLPANYTDSLYYAGMYKFQNDEPMKAFEDEADKQFKDLKPIESNIEEGFKHLKYHFPNGKIPKDVVFMNLHLTSSVFCTEKEIGIGLEGYLGKESDPVQQYLDPNVWYEWVRERMNKEYLERDVIINWIQTHYVDESEGNLAEHIVRWGKVLYLTKAAFPKMEDYKIMRYSKEGWDWAEKNEASFWKYLVDLKALFKSDELNLMNMINPGPTTSGLPEDGSPDRMGQYIGYKMVLNYMEKTETKVGDLIEIPYNDILQEYEID